MRHRIAAAILTVTLAVPAAAHTPEEVDVWMADWAAGHTLETLDQFLTRHPYLTRTVAPHRHDTTDRTRWDHPDGVEAWRPLVEAHFPASEVERALCIMALESGGNPDAQNSTSGAAGLFQHIPAYWTERSTAAGLEGADIWNPHANVAVAAWLAGRDGWRHWAPYQRGNCR